MTRAEFIEHFASNYSKYRYTLEPLCLEDSPFWKGHSHFGNWFYELYRVKSPAAAGTLVTGYENLQGIDERPALPETGFFMACCSNYHDSKAYHQVTDSYLDALEWLQTQFITHDHRGTPQLSPEVRRYVHALIFGSEEDR